MPEKTTTDGYGPGAGPSPQRLSETALLQFLEHRQKETDASILMGTLATNKRSGHPHLSVVACTWDAATRTARISTTADRLKVRHLRKNHRCSLQFTSEDLLSFAVAEGSAELSSVSAVPGDEVGRELLRMRPPFEQAEDETAYLEQMVADSRLVIRVRVHRLYGTTLEPSTDA